MAKRRIKTVKTTLLTKGNITEYQSVLEGTIGDLLSSLDCYMVSDEDTEIDGTRMDRDRAYFIPDCDYEIIIRPKK